MGYPHGHGAHNVINPATEEVVATVPICDTVDVNTAVAAAKEAFKTWSLTSAAERAAMIETIAASMKKRREELAMAHTQSMGCPVHIARAIHVDGPIFGFKSFARRAFIMEQEELVKEAFEDVIVGAPLDEATDMGPMCSAGQLNIVKRYIDKGIAEGARLVTGGSHSPEGLNKGHYIKPTVFADVHNRMTIAREEIFGPVLCIIPYRDLPSHPFRRGVC